MKRLTFEGNFCDIAQCREVRYGSFCEDGYCSQRRVWEKLKRYEDLEEQGRLVILPCGNNAVLMHDGKEYTADHWNHSLSAFRNEPTNRSGKQVALFSIAEAEAALAASGKEG